MTYALGHHASDTKWEAKMATVHLQQKAADDLRARADRQLQSDRDKTLAALNQKLVEQQAAHDAIKPIIKEVTKYVTAKADSKCELSAGFAWLSNRPLTSETPGLAESPPGDADAPTGLKASEVAATIAFNNDEAVKRGELLTQWRTWYLENKALWEQRQADEPAPVPLP
jgi:hypothetical protein